jgi:tartrate dehydrogenase/decarboxylase/D-malate dehydrogenase
VTLWGLRLEIVQGFDQAISSRPGRLLPGIRGPLADRRPEAIDFVVVRENTEGEYAGVAGFAYRGQPSDRCGDRTSAGVIPADPT